MSDETQTDLCRCGHRHDAHQHFRPGSDCGSCGAAVCATYRRATPVTRPGLLGRITSWVSHR